MFKKNNRKGFSLLELMLVLAIVAALVVIAFITYSKVSDNYRINTAIKELITIKTIVQETYSSQGNYQGLTDTVITAQLPDNLKSFYNIYKAPFGVSASWMTPSKTANSGFYISYYVKKDDCYPMVKRLLTSFTYILINSNTAVDTINSKTSDDSTLYTYCTSQTGNQYANLQVYSY